MKRLFIVLVFVALAVAGRAAIVVQPAIQPLKTGTWYGDFDAVTNYAVQADVPAILVYSMSNCYHCRHLEDALSLDEGKDWVSTRNAVFCYAKDLDEPVWRFIKGDMPIPYTPIVRVYWPNHGKGASFNGQQDLPGVSASSGTPQERQELLALLKAFEEKASGIVPEIDAQRTFVGFPMGDSESYPFNRLEAVEGVTKTVSVPLVRTNGIDKAATTVVTFKYNAGAETRETVQWNAGERERFVVYTMPDGFHAGERVVVTLKESASAVPVATCHIWCVADSAYENSPKNPRWIGERSAAELNWGEWTMDLAVATQKVSQMSGSGTLVLVGGSLWCPDCYSTDRYLIDTPEFKAWASDNKIACVAIDVSNPKDDTYPSLLKWNSMRVSDRYCSCNNGGPTNETLRYQSGAGYLSRHGVTDAEAKEIFARNQNLLCLPTTSGGLCRPEDAEGDGKVYGFKTGIPCLILMRPNGTIAGRIYQFSNTSASSAKDLAAHLCRLDELLGQADVFVEEENDHQLTTREMLPLTTASPISASLSAVDGQDVYAIQGEKDERVNLTVCGSAAATVTLTVTDDSGTVPVRLGESRGLLSDGVTLSVKLTSSCCHLTVGFPKDGNGYALDGPFSFTKADSTVCAYTLASVGGKSNGELGFAVAVTNVPETCGTVAFDVFRRRGSQGAVSAKVKLVAVEGEGGDVRVIWSDQTVRWGDGQSGNCPFTLEIVDDQSIRHDLTLRFELTDLEGGQFDLEVASGQMTVIVHDNEFSGVRAYRSVRVSEMRTVDGYQSGDEIRCVVTDGELPSGIQLSVVGDQVIASGCADAPPGEYSAVCSVSVWRNGKRVGPEQKLEPFVFSVVDYNFAGDIPSLATVRTYGGLQLVDDSRLTGLLTLTVPADGALSAKYVRDGVAYAYATDGWEAFEAGVLTARLTLTADASRSMGVTLSGDGGRVEFVDPADGVTMRQVALTANPWPEGSAAAWQGQYAVQLPQTNVEDGVSAGRLGGAAYLAMRMASDEAIATGTMLYAGVLPNGRAVYGSAVLQPTDDGRAEMPFAAASDLVTAPYSFAGSLAIDANAAETYQMVRWGVRSALTPNWTVPDVYGHSADFEVYGGYYDSSEVTARFNEQFVQYAGRLDNFAFQADAETLAVGRYGSSAVFAPAWAEMTGTNVPQLVSGTECVTLTFSTLTGVISGSFEVPFADGGRQRVFYRGIALPGWQSCATCVIGVEAVERPWAVGACSFTDLTDNMRFFRNGCEIRLDKVKGEGL